MWQEYNALLIGLQIARKLGVRNLQACNDSEIIVCQVRGEYEVKNENLIPYHRVVIHLAKVFEHFYIGHISLRHSTHADTLASLAVSLALPAGASKKVLVFSRDLYCPKLIPQQMTDRDVNLPSVEAFE